MKIIMSGLFLVILGMFTLIFINANSDKGTYNNSFASKKEGSKKNGLDSEVQFKEMCKRMPEMKGCDKYDDIGVPVGEIKILKNNIQLGEIPMDEGKIEIVFEIQNIGESDVILGGADGSCFCTQGFISNTDGSNKSPEINTIGTRTELDLNRVIKPGEKQTVTAIYDPLAHGPNAVGYTTRGLTLKTNSKKTPVLKLDFSGTVVKTRSK